jgi:hypothetical protein
MLREMKINAIKPRVQYVGDGFRSQFFFPFPIFLTANLEVYLGTERQTSGFVVNGVGESDGGSVIFTSPPASGVLVTLRRQLAVRRLSYFQDSGQFRARVLNDELDHLTATVQQLETEAARTIRLNPADRDEPLILPEADKRAGHTIVFDQQGALTTCPLNEAASSSAWRNLDDVPEGILHKHFSDADLNKLRGIEPGAERNPASVNAEEKAAGTETELRLFSPRDIRDIAVTHSTDGAVSSVHGRTGAVTAEAGDYTAEQIAETGSRVVMTAEERSKLAGVEPGARAYPPLVTELEKSTPETTEIRAFSPKDISDMIASHGSVAVSYSDVNGGHAATTFNSFIDGGLASV